MRRIPVSVLGATGMVGQRFVSLLQDHPWFEVAALCASERSKGRRYGEFWRLEGRPLEAELARSAVESIEPHALARRGVQLAFSGLPAEEAKGIETACAQEGLKVFSNASAHRMDPDVPLLIPEINPDHLRLVRAQQQRSGTKGFIVANANCTITGLALGLKPLVDAYKLHRVFVTTYQALSGAGYPGVPSLDIAGNVLPFIEKEEEKVAAEARKILGSIRGNRIVDHDLEILANCARVNVRDGHLEAVTTELPKPQRLADVAKCFSRFRGVPQRLRLPTAPEDPIIVRREPDRPQPLKDVDAGEPHRARGMAVTVGRIRLDGPTLRFYLLVHNTLRGAAGASVLNAELAKAEGYL